MMISLCVVAYILAYSVAMCVWFEATGKWLPMFRVDHIVRENLGLLVRWAWGLQGLQSMDPQGALECPAHTRAAIKVHYERIAQRMRRQPLAYPASQWRALDKAMTVLMTRAVLKEAFERTVNTRQSHGSDPAFAEWHGAWERVREAARAEQARRQTQGSRASGSMMDWRSVLGLSATETRVDQVKGAYRRLASRAHPDRGGSAEQMARLNAAMEQARIELAFV